MRKLAPFAALLVVAVGCKPKLEDQVVGSWSGPNNMTFTVNKEKTWASQISAMGTNISIDGTWAVEGDTLKLTTVNLAGQPAAQAAQQALNMAKSMKLPKAQIDQIGEITSNKEFTISDDGKTLNRKNPPAGGITTLTKK